MNWGRLWNLSPVLSIYAGGIAFFFLLSLVPFLVVTLGTVAVFSPLELAEPVSAILSDLIPEQEFLNIASIVSTAQQAGGQGLLTVTFLFALWTASSFMGSLTHALHLVFSTDSPHPKSGWRVWLYSVVMVVIWALFLTLTAVLFLIAPVIEAWLVRGMLLPEGRALIIKAVRFGFLFLMFTVAFGASYRLNAPRSTPTHLCLQGGMIATIGWLVGGWAFTHWLPVFWQKSVAFGALGSVVATLMWAYAAAWTVLLAAAWVAGQAPRG